MLIKTLLNKIERFKSFVYGTARVMLVGGTEALVIDIEPRRNSRPIAPSAVPILIPPNSRELKIRPG